MMRKRCADPTTVRKYNVPRLVSNMVCASVAALSLASCSPTAEVNDGGLEGVWQLEEMLIVGADGGATRSPLRASQYIFTDRHYSMMVRLGND